MIVMLDAGPLGLVTNPKASPESLRAKDWLVSLLYADLSVALPEVVDYEVRRELLRAGKVNGLRHLDGFKARSLYVPITTEAMVRAAEFWARLRQSGLPTADPRELDCDVILAAQASLLSVQMDEPVVIATTNVGHLSRLVPTKLWPDIQAGDYA